MDLDILGFIDHNITVNVIKDGEIGEKELICRNRLMWLNKTRAVSLYWAGIKHVFILADPEKEVYRCKYCDEVYRNRNK